MALANSLPSLPPEHLRSLLEARGRLSVAPLVNLFGVVYCNFVRLAVSLQEFLLSQEEILVDWELLSFASVRWIKASENSLECFP